MTYKYGNTSFVTPEGVEKFVQESRTESSMKRKEQFLEAFHAGYAALRATTTVDTSRPYTGVTGPDENFEKESVEEMALIRQQRSEALMIRARNEEEIRHINNVKAAQVEQMVEQHLGQERINFLEQTQKDIMQDKIREYREENQKYDQKMLQKINSDAQAQKDAIQQRVRIEREENQKYEQKMQKINSDALAQKDAMQQRIRIERDETLQYDQKMLENEKAKVCVERDRLMLDPKYMLAFLKANPVEPPPKKSRKEQDPEAKKQAYAARTLKSATTRREKKEALQEKERLEHLHSFEASDNSAEAVKARYEDLLNRLAPRRNG